MRKFYDKNVDLHWLENETAQDILDTVDIKKMVNTWSSPAINKYVADGIELDDFMNAFIVYTIGDKKDTKLSCYCYYAMDDKDRPIGIVDISTNDNRPNEAYIEYLAVNPNMTGRGIGTRMIKSIIDNGEWFSHNFHVKKWDVSIHKENTASKKAFLKNKFKQYTPAETVGLFTNPVLNRYYFARPRTHTLDSVDYDDEKNK